MTGAMPGPAYLPLSHAAWLKHQHVMFASCLQNPNNRASVCQTKSSDMGCNLWYCAGPMGPYRSWRSGLAGLGNQTFTAEDADWGEATHFGVR